MNDTLFNKFSLDDLKRGLGRIIEERNKAKHIEMINKAKHIEMINEICYLDFRKLLKEKNAWDDKYEKLYEKAKRGFLNKDDIR